jgi:hypothetical protein
VHGRATCSRQSTLVAPTALMPVWHICVSVPSRVCAPHSPRHKQGIVVHLGLAPRYPTPKHIGRQSSRALLHPTSTTVGFCPGSRAPFRCLRWPTGAPGVCHRGHAPAILRLEGMRHGARSKGASGERRRLAAHWRVSLSRSHRVHP